MTSRWARALRVLVALIALSGAAAVVTAEPAAPSAYATALELSSVGYVEVRTAVSNKQRAHARGVFHAPPTAASKRLSARCPAQPRLVRAPRLYLRHGVLLR